MRALLACTAVLTSTALAAPGDERPPPRAAPGAVPVIGGTDVPDGAWRDVAAVLFGGQQGCTGVLIAPTVVLTASHCLDRDLDAVLIGTNSLARPSAGERIDVAQQIDGPGAYDVAMLILERPSSQPVRKLATGWVQSQVVDGATVAFVGYGAIDRDAMTYVDELREATSTITDAACTTSAGCEPSNRPAGEIGAGGAGIDTCPGDSGGPMYLVTEHGAFLAGITSRGYDNNQFECSEGGIYTRPDKAELVAWVEAQAGVTLEDGLHPTGDAMTIVWGTAERQTLDAADPWGSAHDWEIVTPPVLGTASLSADGTLTVTAPAADGDDVVVVRAIDRADASRSAEVRIALAYRETDDDDDSGGCCSTGGAPAAPSLLAAATVLLGLRRRRSAR